MIKNQLKTVVLLGLLTGLLLWIGSFWGKAGLFVGLVFAILMNVGSYFFSDKLILFMYKAKEVSKHDAPNLHKIVDEVSKEAGIPKPKVYIVPTATPNAFATGRNPKHAVVACTSGILKLLTGEELKGVIAHEVSHIRNRDILIQTIAATIAGVISYVAFMARWAAIFGTGGRDRGGGGSAISLLVLAIITPIIAMLLQLAISRSREYLADESAARLLKTGAPLANALEKLEIGVRHHPMDLGTDATSSLFILNPFSAKGLLNLLSTHPPINERTKRLKLMKF